LDGGVRRGSDIHKALALGAGGVLTGRATLYGVLAGGQAGADRALDILNEELIRSMQLCGTPRISDIDRRLIAGSNPVHSHAG
ncbi:alpha-hydroxy-acid oxidizing protein, partial [Bordetella hinzii]